MNITPVPGQLRVASEEKGDYTSLREMTPTLQPAREDNSSPVAASNDPLLSLLFQAKATPTAPLATSTLSGGAFAKPDQSVPAQTAGSLTLPPQQNTPTPFATLDLTLPTPPLPIPPPAVPLAKPNGVMTLLLLGNDVPWAQGGRTDSLILIALNRENGSIKMLSIPRDLFVVIPGWRMTRINLALPHGHGSTYPGGGGGLVRDTILYNLGIPVDHYARIGFSGFKEIIDGLGGVEIVVNCPIEDWRLKEPTLDPEIESNWESYLLPPGIHHMDGEQALWYVRTRKNSNDIDRGRRQQKMVRAILQQVQSNGMQLDLPVLWHNFSPMFETDLPLSTFLKLAAMAPEIENVEHIVLGGETLRSWRVPDTGEAVQLLNREAAELPLTQFISQPALNKADRAPVLVEVETHDPFMYRQVAENLIWYGFRPKYRYREERDPAQTQITYNGNNTKGVFPERLAAIFRQSAADIQLASEGAKPMRGYHIDLGRLHDPCLPFLELSEIGFLK